MKKSEEQKPTVQELEEQLQKAKQAEAERIEAERKQEQTKLLNQRNTLLDSARNLRAMAASEALEGKISESKHCIFLAEQKEREASLIVLDGENPIVIDEKTFIPSEHFGKGKKWTFFPIWRTLFAVVSIIVLGYISHIIHEKTDQLSIAFWSDLQHFCITTLNWSLMWFVVDIFIYRKYRAVYDFMNTHEFPQFDFVSRCLDSNSPERYAFYLLCLKAVSFVLMYLHNPITNGGS